MNNNVEVSVIVLTYNQDATIARALDSVLGQKCSFKYEILVSDDASTDDTRRICEDYAKKHPDKIRLITTDKNKGIVNNYFDTFELCQGKYIADCSGDDAWYKENRLQLLYDTLTSDKSITIAHSNWLNLDCSTGDITPCDPNNNNDDIWQHRISGRKMLKALLQHRQPFAIHLSAALYRANILKKALSTNPDMVKNQEMGCEDMPIAAALLSAGDVAFIDSPTLIYSINGNSATGITDKKRAANFHLRTSVATIRLARHYGIPLCHVRDGISKKMQFAMAMTFQIGDANMRDKIEMQRKKHGMPITMRYRIMYWVSACKPLWKLIKLVR